MEKEFKDVKNEIGNAGHSVFVKKYCLGKISILNHHIISEINSKAL